MLEFDEMTILVTRLHEFTMIATRDDRTSVEHIDTVNVLDRRETMSDDDARTAIHELLQ